MPRGSRACLWLLVATALSLGGCGDDKRATTAVLVYTKQRYVGLAQGATLFVARPDGSDSRRVTNGRSPYVSPDGRWVAFRRSSEADLYVVPTVGGTPRRVARNAGAHDWSPDSRSLAVVIGRSLAIVDVESGDERTIVHDEEITALDFSPNGNEIAWVRHEQLPRPIADLSYREDIYLSSVDGGNPRRLTSSGHATAPVWGPKLIAFSRFEDDPLTAHFFYEAWLMRPDGSGERRLGKPRSQVLPLAWSTDGRRLLAAYESVASFVPVALNPASDQERPIGSFGAEAYTEGFSRDGRFVLVSDRGNLVRLSWDGGARVVLVRNVGGGADWNL